MATETHGAAEAAGGSAMPQLERAKARLEQRGELLEAAEDKAEDLLQEAQEFERLSKQLKKQMKQ